MIDFERAAELAGALQLRLHALEFPLSAITEGEIRQGVCEYADELRHLGVPPERVILAMKRAANEAGLYPTMRVAGISLKLEGKDKLLADMVGWCIERYYGPPPRAD